MITNQIIIHFGQNINRNMYEHNISIDLWSKYLNSQRCKSWDKIIEDVKYKTYYCDNLIYEFDILNGTHICYYNLTSNIKSISLNNNENIAINKALLYESKKTILDYKFQPINKYYNENEYICTSFENDQSIIIFEKHKNSHEIKIIMKNILTWEKDIINIFNINNINELCFEI